MTRPPGKVFAPSVIRAREKKALAKVRKQKALGDAVLSDDQKQLVIEARRVIIELSRQISDTEDPAECATLAVRKRILGELVNRIVADAQAAAEDAEDVSRIMTSRPRG